MTPAARIAAAIEIVDRILAGEVTEKALTSWARSSRFAGSKDRAAVRDHVFDAVRNLRSYGVRGGGAWPDVTGRSVLLGAARATGLDPTTVFSGQGHAPAPLTQDETVDPGPSEGRDRWNLPDWLADVFQTDLGTDAFATAETLGTRAPVTLRVNLAVQNLDYVVESLANDGISVQPNARCNTALTVGEGARRISQSSAYLNGWVELQDASSQASIQKLSLGDKPRVLDYCAGGGGKALAIAAQTQNTVWAHDANANRMRDLPERARRAGADIRICSDMAAHNQPFDVVFVDAPCSGSGTWRRTPDAKWRLTPKRLKEFQDTQIQVLGSAVQHLGAGGQLAYATCSVFQRENEDVVQRFCATTPGLEIEQSFRWPISAEGDGFFLSLLRLE